MIQRSYQITTVDLQTFSKNVVTFKLKDDFDKAFQETQSAYEAWEVKSDETFLGVKRSSTVNKGYIYNSNTVVDQKFLVMTSTIDVQFPVIFKLEDKPLCEIKLADYNIETNFDTAIRKGDLNSIKWRHLNGGLPLTYNFGALTFEAIPENVREFIFFNFAMPDNLEKRFFEDYVTIENVDEYLKKTFRTSSLLKLFGDAKTEVEVLEKIIDFDNTKSFCVNYTTNLTLLSALVKTEKKKGTTIIKLMNALYGYYSPRQIDLLLQHDYQFPADIQARVTTLDDVHMLKKLRQKGRDFPICYNFSELVYDIGFGVLSAMKNELGIKFSEHDIQSWGSCLSGRQISYSERKRMADSGNFTYVWTHDVKDLPN